MHPIDQQYIERNAAYYDEFADMDSLSDAWRAHKGKPVMAEGFHGEQRKKEFGEGEAEPLAIFELFCAVYAIPASE